jgi:hypothetical protein
LDNYLIIKEFRRQDSGVRIQDSGDRSQETRDYFYLFFPLPHFPITPHPTPHTPHPTPHTLFLNKKIISPELNRDVFLPW